MDVFDAIRLRRSIKPEKMKPDPVPRELLDRMLEAANWAPSHRLTEPWRFVVYTGDARAELAEAIGRGMTDDGSPLPADDPRRAKLATKCSTAPVIIAIVCATSDHPKIVEHEEIASTAIAVQNMHLAARALGLAAFWSSGTKAFSQPVADHLGIEAPARCLGFLYVGFPAVPWPDGSRRSIDEKVTWKG